MAQDRKVALVTGGAVRVGRAIVQRLSQAGFDVAFTYWNSQTQAQELQSPKICAIRADLSDPSRAIDEIAIQFAPFAERLDVLVNNASDFLRAKLSDTKIDQVRRLNAIHLESPLLLCQKFEPMLRAARGHVINMIDLLVERPWQEYLAYCASKAALASLTLGLARELAPEVTVNGISPGVVQWPENTPEAEKEKYLKRVPLGRAGTPQDVANLVHFLCTEGSYMTGQIIRLDGGRSIT
jgi:pteridine reductase